MNPLLEALRVTRLIVAETGWSDLPLPYSVTATDYGYVDMTFRTLDDLTAWSTYVDEPIESRKEKGYVHHWVRFERNGQKVRLGACVPVHAAVQP